MTNAAIGFAADGFRTDRPKLMGRHVAGEGFLRGFIRHAGVDRLAAYLLDPQAGADFQVMAQAAGARMPLEAIPPQRMDLLARIGTVMLPGPDVTDLARRRRFLDPRGFSIVGVTHTTASAAAMAAIADLAAGPARSWDALICTSRAVEATVQQLLGQEEEDLAARLGASRFERPLLPVIPLGVDCEALTPPEGARTAWRAKLGLAEGEVAVLSVGRLSWHAKAHPLPLFAALGRAARQSGTPRLHCILAGWFSDPGQEAAHRQMAAALAPEVKLTVLDGRDRATRDGALAAADVFALLVDNIQETFGLAPVEAMAAGLPVLVSDWDGFKDTVRHGEDGFRIPSLIAPPGSAADLALLHASGAESYDRYLAATTQLVALDIPATTEALLALARDAGLRARMGQAGQARTRALYDWRVVIGQYQALWRELGARRAAAAFEPTRPDPRQADPTLAFGHYASGALTGETLLTADPAAPADLAALAKLPAALHRGGGGVGAEGLQTLMKLLLPGRTTRVKDILTRLRQEDHRAAMRGLLWLLKAGFIRKAGGE